MQKISTQPYLILLFVILSLTSISNITYSQEKIVFNETVDWTWPIENGFSGNSFLRWHIKYGSYNIINLGDMPTSSWTSPYNYRNGTFYLRLEIISQPTSNAFSVVLGIWQDYSTVKRECISSVAYLPTGGAGKVIEKNIGSPASWYQNNPSYPVDFSRPNDFNFIGLVLWKGNAECIPMAQGWTNPAQCPDATTQKNYFFPMEVKITVVAVAAGHTFSGWDTYTGSTRPPTPAYAIDFINENTTTIVSATDEYSTNQSTWTSGSGSKITLTPGQDMYFRTKAVSGTPASLVQSLDVPSRPAAPTFTYDAANQRTTQTVSSAYQYADNSAMTGAITGTGTVVSFAFDETMYFRKLATSTAFKSAVQTLAGFSQAAAPTYAIDYINETTSTPVPSTDEYSTNQSTWTSGSGSKITLTPGQDKYFRTKAVSGTPASLVQSLDVPSRPATPTFTYDAANQRTTQTVSSAYQYADNSAMTGAITGTGTVVSFAFDETMYFRKLATSTAFKSAVQTLAGFSQAAAPTYAIDYINETTATLVPSTDEYSTNQTTWNSGTGVKISLTPGQNVFLRKKNAPTYIQELVVPVRPAQPAFAIDYINERTSTVVSSLFEYSTSSNMASATTGSGQFVTISPSATRYFRKRATNAAFSSNIQALVAVARPAAPVININFINKTTNEIIPSTMEYSGTSNFATANTGTGATIAVIPGSTLYFRNKATASKFQSLVKTLTIPANPAAPTFGINFTYERTSVTLSSDYEYSVNADMTSALSGTNAALNLTPGTDVYFRKKANSTAFESAIQHLMVPDRPAAPAITIDFALEKTAEAITNAIHYSEKIDFVSTLEGIGSTITVTPGKTIYFRYKPAASAFTSEILTLEVPERPVIESDLTSPVSQSPIELQIIFSDAVTGLEKEDFFVTNGTVDSVAENHIASIVPLASGLVSVALKANSVSPANFASDTFSITYSGVTAVNDFESEGIKLYPTVSPSLIILECKSCNNESYYVVDVNGRRVLSGNLTENNTSINIEKLSPATYQLILVKPEKNIPLRFIKSLE